MPDMAGKVCPNHPNTEAVSRCTACFKPLCGDCVMERNGEDFCSEKCAVGHFTTNAHVGDMLERDRRRARAKMIRNLVILVILAALAAAGYVYYQQNKDAVDRRIREGGEQLREMKNQVEEAVE